MCKALFALVLIALTTSQRAVSQQKEVMVPVHQFVDGFNKGDVKSAVAACADQTSIIDEFPPHEWHGAGACQKWANDYEADARKNGVTDGIVTLARPRHVDVAGDYAYVVVPASYKYKEKGKPVEEATSTLTIALQRAGAGWRITAWTWTKQ